MPKPGFTDEWRWFLRELRPFLRTQLLGIGALLGATVLFLVDPLILKWLVNTGLEQGLWLAIGGVVGLFCLIYVLRILLLSLGTLVV